MEHKKYIPYEEYLTPQICPVCNRSHPVGKLAGGKVPKYFCRSCLIEFDVRKTEDDKIIAETPSYTASGIKSGSRLYKYQKRKKSFVPI